MENQKKQPLRMCIGCREMKSKDELLRVIRTSENEIMIDPTGRKNGRGAYICKGSEGCLDKAVRTKALERALKTPVPAEVLSKLREEIRGADQT